jgi:hypothetical protein
MSNQEFPRIPKAAAQVASVVLALIILGVLSQIKNSSADSKHQESTVEAVKEGSEGTKSSSENSKITLLQNAAASKAAIEAVAAAKTSVQAQLHQINRTEMNDAIIKAAKAGARVTVILDRASANYARTAVTAMINAGATVVVDKSVDSFSGNTIVIDEKKLLVGSMWFGKNNARVFEQMISTDDDAIIKEAANNLSERTKNGELQKASSSTSSAPKPATAATPAASH